MGDLNKYFSRSEFSCSDNCGFNAVDVELLDILTKVREHYNKPVNITNACRCAKKNKEVNGSPNSQHMNGMAADIWIKDVDTEELADWIDWNLLNGRGGIGKYPNFVHVDVRKNLARWEK